MTNFERICEIKKQIEQLKQELFELNPYAGLKEMSNKVFGEEWSESHIIQNCPNLTRVDGKGYDLYSQRLGRIEVKSSRLPCKQITFNQVHPYDCDYFLFALYETEEGYARLYLVPSKDLLNETLFSMSGQHERPEAGKYTCFSMQANTKKNSKTLENYRITWEELNGKA